MGSNASLRILPVLLLLLGALALTPIGQTAAPDFGEPLAGLGSEELAKFQDGKSDFVDVETVESGVGPVFNDVSCASCHSVPAVGGGSARLETRFGTMTNGQFDPLTQLGGSLIQEQGIGTYGGCSYVPEIVPGEATIVAGRRTTPLFGLGLVDAVPDATFPAIAAVEAQNPDGIDGVVSMVTNLANGRQAVGKFGWKGQNPTLFQFSGDAYVNEMGVTNP